MGLTNRQLRLLVGELQRKNTLLEQSLKKIDEDIEKVVYERLSEERAKIDGMIVQIDILIQKIMNELPDKSQVQKDQ